MGFVSTNSTQFIIINDGGDYGESPFYVIGWNSYWLMMESVRSSSRPKVSPGVFNERVFKAVVKRKNSLSGVKLERTEEESAAVIKMSLIKEHLCNSLYGK
ncbi:hypothetical protein OIU84_026706 [Salix udensis]|uniref:Uncharacterized protein n=1 Tax=Salix udensis TaxID=889485 RepID=A0AAD6KMG8_9ROSI|nr:hypothetical protein OIU84_026706 [Salix udensis]